MSKAKTYLGKRVQSFESAPQFNTYSRVEIIVSEDLYYTAGTDTGRTLTIENPWGTQTIANNILAKIKNFRYKPYTADGALLDPSAELGDGITVNGLYSGIYAVETQYGNLHRANVSAPAEEELDSEYPYTSRSERRVQRKLTSLTTKTAELEVNVEGITATVTAITKEGGTLDTIQSTLTQQAGEISAKVSKEQKGETETKQSFGWTLDESSWTIRANGTQVLTANKDGLEIEGKITAKTGKIGGFDILENELSYNKLTWGGTGYGGYIGQYGIQLGSNFKVDMSGNLEAYSGKFTGSVYAGSIQYGTGTDPVTGVQYGTVSGSALTAATVTTTQASQGITTSLGYADYANGVFSGLNIAPYAYISSLHITEYMYYGDYTVTPKTFSFKDGSGNQVTLYYMGWSRT